VADPGREQAAAGPGVVAGEPGELPVEALEAEIDAERACVLEEERPRVGDVRAFDRQLLYRCSSATAGSAAAAPSTPARLRAPNMRPRAGSSGANAARPRLFETSS